MLLGLSVSFPNWLLVEVSAAAAKGPLEILEVVIDVDAVFNLSFM